MIPTPSPRTTAAGLLAVVAAAMASPPPVGADRYVATNGPRWLVLVDDLHLDFRRTGQIRETLAAAVRPIVLSGVLLRLGTSGPPPSGCAPMKTPRGTPSRRRYGRSPATD